MRFRLLVSLLLCFIIPRAGLAGGIELKGVYSQGGMMVGKVDPGHSVKLNGSHVKVGPNGDFVIGFGRDADLQHTLVSYFEGKEQSRKELVLKKREYNIQRINGVPQQMVTPSKDKLARIKSDAALVKKARKTDLDLYHFLSDFIMPAEGPITGVYGSQRVFNGTPKRPHFGLDIAGPVGTPIIAPAAGVVTLVHNDMYYSGGTLLIDHGFGISSTFIHLDKILVKEGEEISQGQKVAEMGATGRVTGPHLDWRINWFAERLDPQLILDMAEL